MRSGVIIAFDLIGLAPRTHPPGIAGMMWCRRRERAYFESEQAKPIAAMSAEVEALQNIEYGHRARALDRLGNDSRTLLIESFFAERSHSAIALCRATALGTVKTRIRSRLKQLRRFIA